jgi:hypothetical protein
LTSNRSCLPSSSLSSSSITTNSFVLSSSSDQTESDVCKSNIIESFLHTEIHHQNLQSKVCPADISQSSQDLPSQSHPIVYPTDKEIKSYQSRWYINRDWLEYSVDRDAAFGYYCRHFPQFSTPIRFQRDAFTTTGFSNWYVIEVLISTSRVKDITSSANFYEYQSRRKSNTSVINVIE